jgi:hypothetical protein
LAPCHIQSKGVAVQPNDPRLFSLTWEQSLKAQFAGCEIRACGEAETVSIIPAARTDHVPSIGYADDTNSDDTNSDDTRAHSI